MSHLEITNKYIHSWNSHDQSGLVKLFNDKGVYSDPFVGELTDKNEISGYVTALFEAFPDLKFEVLNINEAGNDKVVFEWIMKGTNTGAMNENAATGNKLKLPGVDVVTVNNSYIESVHAYFDRMTYLEQLGLNEEAELEME